MHTQDERQLLAQTDAAGFTPMIYLFAQRQPLDQTLKWFARCGVCEVITTSETLHEALDLVNDHTHTHFCDVV